MGKEVILYSYWRSSCSWRVRSVLEFKKIPYEYRAVNLLKREQFSDDFIRINPLSQVPTLQIQKKDGTTESVFESIAIIDLLEQLYPKPSVYPEDPFERAKVVAVVETIVSGIQPLQNLSPMLKVEEMTGSKEKSLEWSQYWISKKFELLEKMISNIAGRYTVGDQMTLADICLVPQIANAMRFNVDMSKYPTLKRLNDSLLAETDSPIKKAHPDNQPDKP